MAPTFTAPPALRPGRRIAVVAPSSPFDVAAFEEGTRRLRERYVVCFDDGLLSRTGFLAGDDDRRLRELERAIDDPEVDAIVAARGGYGVTRLIGKLDPAAVARRPKLLVGFSDLTALHAVWARAGLRSLHGPMVAALGRAGPGLVKRWCDAVEGAVPAPVRGLRVVSSGRARGPLVGGNLAVLAALGERFLPPAEGCVLFLEDIGEKPYRVDRALTTLRNVGWLSSVSAIALGAFTRCAANADGVTVEEVLAERLGDLGVPVVAGVEAGHVDDNLELPLGADVEVDGDAGVVTFLEAAVDVSA